MWTRRAAMAWVMGLAAACARPGPGTAHAPDPAPADEAKRVATFVRLEDDDLAAWLAIPA